MNFLRILFHNLYYYQAKMGNNKMISLPIMNILLVTHISIMGIMMFIEIICDIANHPLNPRTYADWLNLVPIYVDIVIFIFIYIGILRHRQYIGILANKRKYGSNRNKIITLIFTIGGFLLVILAIIAIATWANSNQ